MFCRRPPSPASLRERSDAYYASLPAVWYDEIDAEVKHAANKLCKAADSGESYLHVTMSRNRTRCAIMEKYAAAMKPLNNGAVLQYTPPDDNERYCNLWFKW
jgi:hypothetical protein